jgi:2,4-dienoyl-CoA reductase-like NADH-dependent reductase (Old Yellow Enzyme family)
MSTLFTPGKIGPITLRNRTIRSAAFEGMCPGNAPSEQLLKYHQSVAAGGIGMTTIAYSAVQQSGLSFPRQLWLKKENIEGLRKVTDAIHKEGAAASIQIGHCGNMSHRNICGCTPISASTGFNLYSPTFVRGMRKDEIEETAKSFGEGVNLAREAGFDAIELHAGHGYLISQFLSPSTNHRKDEFGGSLQNRMRFMEMSMDHVMKAAKNDIGVLVKMNMRDCCRNGMELDESIEVGKTLEKCGAHALVLSSGFVSSAPMDVMRGAMPFKTMTHYMEGWMMPLLVKLGGRFMVPTRPFKEAYFLEDALKFREALNMPLCYIGGLISREKIDEVLDKGFEFVAMARALVNEPGFVNRMMADEKARSACDHSNYCIGRMYTIDMACHKCLLAQGKKIPQSLLDELEKNKRKGY